MGFRGSVQRPFAALLSLAERMIAAVKDDALRRELMESMAITHHETGNSAKARAMLFALIKEDIRENSGRSLSDIIHAACRCGISRREVLELLDLIAGEGDLALEKKVNRVARRLLLGSAATPRTARKMTVTGGGLVRDSISMAHVKNLALSGDTSRYDVAMARLMWGETQACCDHAKAQILIETVGELKRGGHSFKAEQTLKRALYLMRTKVGEHCLIPKDKGCLKVCPHYGPAAFALMDIYQMKGRHEELFGMARDFQNTKYGGFSPYASSCIRLYLPKQYAFAHRLLEVFAGDNEAHASGMDEFVSYHYTRGEVEEMAAFLDMMSSAERRIWSLATEMLNGEEGYHDHVLEHFASLRSYVMDHLIK